MQPQDVGTLQAVSVQLDAGTISRASHRTVEPGYNLIE